MPFPRRRTARAPFLPDPPGHSRPYRRAILVSVIFLRPERMLPRFARGKFRLLSAMRRERGRGTPRAPGEDPGVCGRLELAEEPGLRANTFESLGIFHASPGVFDETIHLFLATGLTQREADPEQYEEIGTIRIPFGEAKRMALSGEITDGKTIAALFRTGAGKDIP